MDGELWNTLTMDVNGFDIAKLPKKTKFQYNVLIPFALVDCWDVVSQIEIIHDHVAGIFL